MSCHFLLQGIFPNPGIEPSSPGSPVLAGRFFTTEEAPRTYTFLPEENKSNNSSSVRRLMLPMFPHSNFSLILLHYFCNSSILILQLGKEWELCQDLFFPFFTYFQYEIYYQNKNICVGYKAYNNTKYTQYPTEKLTHYQHSLNSPWGVPLPNFTAADPRRNYLSWNLFVIILIASTTCVCLQTVYFHLFLNFIKLGITLHIFFYYLFFPATFKDFSFKIKQFHLTWLLTTLSRRETRSREGQEGKHRAEAPSRTGWACKQDPRVLLIPRRPWPAASSYKGLPPFTPSAGPRLCAGGRAEKRR